MVTNFKKQRIYGLIAALVIILAISIAGCSKTASSATTPAVTPSTPAASAAATPAAGQQRRGVDGTLTAVKGNTLTISTLQGAEVSVTLDSATLIQKTVAGSLADLQQGDFLTAVGSQDASGNVVATTIMLRPQGQGQGAAAPVSANGGQGFSASGFGSAQGQITVGTLAGINGNTLTLTNTQGSQVTVTVSSSTAIEKTVASSAADLQPGESLTVTGPTDASGNMTASIIAIRPQPTAAAPSPTPSLTPAATTPAGTPPPTSGSGTASEVSTSVPGVTLAGAPASFIGGSPIILVLAPAAVSNIPAGDVTISTLVSNFNLVSTTGQANADGQGHIIYYVDVTPPEMPGQAATTTDGTYAESSATSYTWHNVGTGFHYFSVQLVNNDNTPLSPSITVTIYVTVQGNP